jgi:teichuronic acid biosynthesis glycosyltransferase TuaH
MAGMTGEWPGLVVVYGDTPWDGYSLVDQRLASGLTNHAPVLYVDPPATWQGRKRRQGSASRGRGGSELRLVRPGLARLTPQLPPGSPSVRRAVSGSVTGRAVRRALASLGSPAVAASVSFGTRARPAVDPGEIRVLVVRDYAELPGWRERATAFGDAVHVDFDADLVVATSPALAAELSDFDPLLLPYGCDDRALAGVDRLAPAPDVLLDHPIAGFVGVLSRRVDVALLREVVERDVSLVLVGPCPQPQDVPGLPALMRHPLVGWVGPRAPHALGPYYRAIDVGLVAYRECDLNQLLFPAKTVDFLAAGRPVVSTDLVSSRWLLDRQRAVVDGPPLGPGIDPVDDLVIASDPVAFADAVERLAHERRDAYAVDRRRGFARYHSWDQRMRVLAARLELAKRSNRRPGRDRHEVGRGSPGVRPPALRAPSSSASRKPRERVGAEAIA